MPLAIVTMMAMIQDDDDEGEDEACFATQAATNPAAATLKLSGVSRVRTVPVVLPSCGPYGHLLSFARSRKSLSIPACQAVPDEPQPNVQEPLASAGQCEGWCLVARTRVFGVVAALHKKNPQEDGELTPNITGEIHVLTRWLPSEMKQVPSIPFDIPVYISTMFSI